MKRQPLYLTGDYNDSEPWTPFANMRQRIGQVEIDRFWIDVRRPLFQQIWSVRGHIIRQLYENIMSQLRRGGEAQ